MTKGFTLKGSFGVGFKSPDFRQLYFNFTNSAGGGYSVLGTEVVVPVLNDLEAQGMIQSYLYDPSLVGKLSAERSKSINVGARIEPTRDLIMDFNIFYNPLLPLGYSFH